MFRRNVLPAAIVVAVSLLAVSAAQAQYSVPGPSGSGSCQPAFQETDPVTSGTALRGWPAWFVFRRMLVAAPPGDVRNLGVQPTDRLAWLLRRRART
jgi:hypothetical protein